MFICSIFDGSPFCLCGIWIFQVICVISLNLCQLTIGFGLGFSAISIPQIKEEGVIQFTPSEEGAYGKFGPPLLIKYTQYAERNLIRVKTFNEIFAGCKGMRQRFRIYFIWNPWFKVQNPPTMYSLAHSTWIGQFWLGCPADRSYGLQSKISNKKCIYYLLISNAVENALVYQFWT